jgi:hypothetical protein
MSEVTPPPPAKRARTPQSAKGKGRRLQQQAAAALVEAFHGILEPDDIISRPMGSPGSDLMLSPLARRALPYDFEMKNVEVFNLWPTLEQAWSRCPTGLVPCVVAKRNNRPPVAIVPFGHWCGLLRLCSTAAAAPLPFGDTVSCNDLNALFTLPSDAVTKNPGQRPSKTSRSTALLSGPVAAALRATLTEEAVQPMVWPNTWLVCNVGPVHSEGASRFCFWDIWHAHLLRCGARETEVTATHKRPPPCALVINRGDSMAPIYVAVPLIDHITLLRRRWDMLHTHTSTMATQ